MTTPLSVRDTGAKGDGLTNDGPAIQQALSTSEWVYFPPGIYATNQKLLIQSGQRITLAGGATIKPVANVGPIRALLYVGNAEDVLIEGPGGINGDATAQPTSLLMGVQIDSGCQRITIRGLTVQGMASDGTGSVGGDGIYIGSSSALPNSAPQSVIIDGCRLLNNHRNGISVTCGTGIKVINCECSGAKFGEGIDVEPNTTAQLADDLLIAGNTVRGNPSAGISIGATRLKAIAVTHAVITNNRLIGNGNGSNSSLVLKTASNVTCAGNIVDHPAASAAVQMSDCQGLLFSSNTVSGGTRGFWLNPQNAGMTANVMVAGNTFMNQSANGIFQDPVALAGITITGNTVSSATGIMKTGFVGVMVAPTSAVMTNTTNGVMKA